MKTIIQIIAIVLLQLKLSAQTIDIYRSGSLVKKISTATLSFPIQTAVDSALSGDSLVLSPHIFKDRKIRVDKDLVFKGTQTTTDSSIIEQYSTVYSIFYITSKSTSVLATNIVFRDIIIQDVGLRCSGKDYGIDSLYGNCIKAYENTDVTITGNSIFRNCGINTSCLIPYILDTTLYGGIAIYSLGKLSLKGNTKIINNYGGGFGPGLYGGAVFSKKELIIQDSVLLENNFCDGGGAIASIGRLIIKDKVKIINNTSLRQRGGAILLRYCNLSISDSVQITGNLTNKKMGAGIDAYRSTISLNNKTFIGNNDGGGIAMKESSLDINDSSVIALNRGYEDHFGGIYAAGIYNKGGTIKMKGGQIIGNYDDDSVVQGMAIYNDTLRGVPTTVSISNARIFNPTKDAKRTIEVFNQDGSILNSDSTWWGESDTSGLIYNNGLAKTSIGSWIVADWSLNKGLPIGYSSTFPIEAYFRLNTGASIPPNMFWMLRGLYNCDYGTFSPDTGIMSSSNLISTAYKSSDTTRLVSIIGTVDADTFRNLQTITGLGLNKIVGNKNIHYTIYPNPINDEFTIITTNVNEQVLIKIVDLSGNILAHKAVSFYNNEATLKNELPNGMYVLEITNSQHFIERISIIVLKKQH